jgi:hypothetical protein
MTWSLVSSSGNGLIGYPVGHSSGGIVKIIGLSCAVVQLTEVAYQVPGIAVEARRVHPSKWLTPGRGST